MANQESVKYYLQPLALAFQKDKSVEEKELHKNSYWKKIIKLPTDERFNIVLVALRGYVQQRNPGFDNGLWKLILDHDFDYMTQKGNPQFLWDAATELESIDNIHKLPLEICWEVLKGLYKSKQNNRIRSFIENIEPKLSREENPNKNTIEWLDKVKIHFSEALKQNSSWGKHFVDSYEEEEAWHRLDQKTKAVMQQYEEDLFYDRSPKPSQAQKEETIKAVQNSNLNKKHKKALIESIKKKG